MCSDAYMYDQNTDVVVYERERVQNDEFASQLAYWKLQLANAPQVLDLPTDHPRPPIQCHHESLQNFALSRELTDALKAMSHQADVPLYTTLVAAFQTLLYRYTGQEDLVIGTVTAGRNQRETHDLIGYFVNTLVLRSDLSGNPTVHELLQRVRETVLRAQAHQEVPFELLVQELHPQRSLSISPLIQVLLTLDPPLSAPPSPWDRPQMDLETGTAKFDLVLALAEHSEGLHGSLEYNTDLFEEASMARMMSHWQVLLEAMTTDPLQSLANLPLLMKDERQRQIVEWNATETIYPEVSLLQLIEAQVERTPDEVAVVFEHKQLTYHELNLRANQVAHYLQGLGVGPDVLVGVCLHRSLEMVIGLLGVLKAGGAYVPLDPDYPQERLAFILDDARSPVLLTQSHLYRQLPASQVRVLCLDTDWPAIAQASSNNVESGVQPHHIAYVIYTSGSTGKPKGAMNTYGAICNRLLWMQNTYHLTTQDRILQKTPFSFDVSVWEIFWPLLVGARVVVARPAGHKDPAYLSEVLKAQEITIVHFIPSMLQIFLEETRYNAYPKLRHVLCGGETLSVELQERFFNCMQAELYNLYGPAEAAIDVTFWHCKRNAGLRGVPIGRPIANTQIYILDQQLQPVPIGVTGELHIGGVGLARGYLNRPELTAQKFIRNPFSAESGSRLYKTGDLARYLPDGAIEFLGRIDHQVKIRGFRIELGEIEAVLESHHAVREVGVVAREDIPGDKRLVAYITLHKGTTATMLELQQYLQQLLPEFMVPASFMMLDKMPIMPNGKLDRRALPVPKVFGTRAGDTYVEPTSLVQGQLVQIWEELLGVHHIGIRDNFFSLGGHSLLAARLIERIRHVFGKKILLAALFAGPTIEQLANVLTRDAAKTSHTSVVAVQAGGSLRPFFFLHGDWTGGAFYCFTLARSLGPEQPFYVLGTYKFTGLQTLPTLEEVAASHIEALRSIQSEGPYLLGGFCNGGLLAYEIARQLEEANQRVDFLGLINPTVAEEPNMLLRIIRRVGQALRVKPDKQAHWYLRVRHALRHVYRHLNPGDERLLDFHKLTDIDARLDTMFPPLAALYNDYVGVFNCLMSRYKLRAYPGEITFYWAADEPAIQKDWSHVSVVKDKKEVKHLLIPGTHLSCVTDYTEVLAERLSTSLKQSQEAALNQAVSNDGCEAHL